MGEYPPNTAGQLVVTWYNVTKCQADSKGIHMTFDTSNNTAQIHVRVTPQFKRAVKMFCVREGTTEQAWISHLIEGELTRQAPDLWKPANSGGRRAMA